MTSTLATVDKEQLHALLLRGWMTHDAMWFANAVQELGIEGANKLNRSAVHGMAAVEAKRISKLLGLSTVSGSGELRQFVDAATELVIPDFMDFSADWSDDGTSVCFAITKCFAFDGVSMLGVAAEYECGIFERIYGWLDAFGVDYQVTPAGPQCLMHHSGHCRREIELTFGDRISQE